VKKDGPIGDAMCYANAEQPEPLLVLLCALPIGPPRPPSLPSLPLPSSSTSLGRVSKLDVDRLIGGTQEDVGRAWDREEVLGLRANDILVQAA
jgi:hypothetical protein